MGICVDGGGHGEPGTIPDEVCVWEWEGECVWGVGHYVFDIVNKRYGFIIFRPVIKIYFILLHTINRNNTK